MKKNNEINKKTDKKTGFSLAEILITLVAIGVIAAIAMPLIGKAKPDKNVMKFKKAHETLNNVIHELIVSDKYYMNGDLGIRKDGTLLDGTHEGDYTYFCNSLADVLSTKKVDCKKDNNGALGWYYIDLWGAITTGQEELIHEKSNLDIHCKNLDSVVSGEIITSDGITLYQQYSSIPFGIKYKDANTFVNYSVQTTEDILNTRVFGGMFKEEVTGLDRLYKPFCVDIDGVNKGEDPFGYGIRYDGKIVSGLRADEWLKKDLYGKNESEQ